MTISAETPEEVFNQIKQQIATHPILLYMKGSPEFPQCGFSSRAVQCIKASGIEFASVDVLAHPEIRRYLPQIANWPTFPQLYVKGELIGGSDIIATLFEQGELDAILRKALPSN